jgi:hypothetical protein
VNGILIQSAQNVLQTWQQHVLSIRRWESSLCWVGEYSYDILKLDLLVPSFIARVKLIGGGCMNFYGILLIQ